MDVQISMGLSTIVSGVVLIAVPSFGFWAVDLAWALWWFNIFLTVLCTFGMPVVMFEFQKLSLSNMTAAWLLPIVPAVVTAATGGLVATVLPIEHAQITVFVSYALMGVGLSLSFMIMALYYHRLSVHHIPNAEVVVSAFLPLGPCGQGAYGIIELAQAGQRVFSVNKFAGQADAGQTILVISVVFGLMIWGLGLWWLIHGTTCVILRMRSENFKSSMGWWGFVFPLGVFVAGTVKLGLVIPSAFFSFLSLVLLACVFLLYITVLFLTFKGLYDGTMLVAPCMSDLKQAQKGGKADEAPGPADTKRDEA